METKWIESVNEIMNNYNLGFITKNELKYQLFAILCKEIKDNDL